MQDEEDRLEENMLMFKLQAVCTLKATCSISLVLTFIKLTRAKCVWVDEWVDDSCILLAVVSVS